MSDWDSLSEAQKAALIHRWRRTHSSVVKAEQLALTDMRDRALAYAADWLAGHGFDDAAAAFEAAHFEAAEARLEAAE
ncbi:MAG TPA: hypothetical protein VD863_07030 [Bradyrhizobium sp.]|nr:hypothetical protein [Bradyrhizobium sp.]